MPGAALRQLTYLGDPVWKLEVRKAVALTAARWQGAGPRRRRNFLDSSRPGQLHSGLTESETQARLKYLPHFISRASCAGMARPAARARGVRELLLLLSLLLADPAACTPFIAARTQPAERRKAGLVAAHALHGAENTLRSAPSIPALILATVFETVLHRAVCSSPCDAGSVLMMTPASAALDEEVEDGDGATRAADVSMGRLVVQMAQSYFRGLATLVRMLLRQPEAPQALILVTVLGFASQLAIGPSLARSGARLTSQVRS